MGHRADTARLHWNGFLLNRCLKGRHNTPEKYKRQSTMRRPVVTERVEDAVSQSSRPGGYWAA